MWCPMTADPRQSNGEWGERHIINNATEDPFAGSGSTLIACETTGRHARLIELDPRYVDVIVKRWQDYTGQKAVLEADGREFEQIALERS